MSRMNGALTPIQQAKAALRTEIKKRLAALTDGEKERQSEIVTHCCSYPSLGVARDGPDMKMVLLKSWEDYLSLPETKWKIKQPKDTDVRPDALETGGLDLILVPGLGFTKKGDRLGRGRGYYDSYIKKCEETGKRPLLIALAFYQQICDTIPVNETDRPVDIVLFPEKKELDLSVSKFF